MYIKPSPDLALAGVEYVDEEGGVELPYLKAWKEVKDRGRVCVFCTCSLFATSQLSQIHEFSMNVESLQRPLHLAWLVVTCMGTTWHADSQHAHTCVMLCFTSVCK